MHFVHSRNIAATSKTRGDQSEVFLLVLLLYLCVLS
jgi:hypothetical protein